MAEFPGNKVKKGILKAPGSRKADNSRRKTKWDELNIKATYHPPDKDYGHMKVEEPKTPYSWGHGSDSSDEGDGVDPIDLAERLAHNAAQMVRETDSESDSDVEMETEEERVKRNAFEAKRKAHYNEYAAVKLARRLMETEEEEEDDDAFIDSAEGCMQSGVNMRSHDSGGN